MPVLDPYSVCKRARRHGYREVPSGSPNVLSFEHHRKLGCGGWRNKYGPVTVDVDFEEGEVVTHLNHNNSGHTQLARDVFSHNQLEKIFRNPRVHTSRGRHVGNQQQDDEWYDEDGEEDDWDWEDDWDDEEDWDWDCNDDGDQNWENDEEGYDWDWFYNEDGYQNCDWDYNEGGYENLGWDYNEDGDQNWDNDEEGYDWDWDYYEEGYEYWQDEEDGFYYDDEPHY